MESEKTLQTMTFAEFLSESPPYTEVLISDYRVKNMSVGGQNLGHIFNRPDITYHCKHERCKDKGRLTFNPTSSRADGVIAKHEASMLEYRCSNCQHELKIFSVLALAQPGTDGRTRKCVKLGEMPAFGPPIPPLLIKIVGTDRELFLKGRRCESQGLGIASFAYYRRVIEDQKNRLFEQVIKVARLLEPSSEIIAELERAKDEVQFTKSVGMIKAAIPQSLMISGHNPLTLLHSALSEGLHAHSDEECLEIAGEIRTVLACFAEKITTALNEDREVQDAVRKLAQRRQNKQR